MSSDREAPPAPKSIAVFDCMTFLQAVARAEGPAAACFRFVEEGHVRLVVSADILREVRDVLGRPKIRRRNPKLTDEVVAAFLVRVTELANLEENILAAFTYNRDPKDEPYLNLAIATKAEYVVSRDKDLLDLMSDENTEGQKLRTLIPGIKVLTPPDFLHEMRSRIIS